MTYQDNYEVLSLQADVFKALGHPTRIFIVQKLLEREYCVNELTKMIGVEMPTISKHLSVLRNVEIITSRKENNNIFYRIKNRCVENSLKCSREIRKDKVK